MTPGAQPDPSPGLSLQREGHVLVATLNRPDVRNVLDIPLRNALGRMVEEVRDDASVKALLLTGAGGNFCAGGDLRSLSAQRRSAAENRQRFMRMQWWMRDLIQLEKPVVAAVDGAAYGGGFCLALAADFVLASPRAKFCMSFAKLGMVPDLSALHLLPRMVGLARAKDIVFTGRAVPADEARSLGLVYEIVPSEQLLASAMALARRISRASAIALGQAKVLLTQAFEISQRAAADFEVGAEAVCIDSDFHHEAVRRFLAKEPPLFDWERPDPDVR